MAGDAEYPLLANADDTYNKEQNVVVYKAFGTENTKPTIHDKIFSHNNGLKFKIFHNDLQSSKRTINYMYKKREKDFQ